MTDPYFEIHEHLDGGRLRLRLTGELDLGSVPVLKRHLQQVRAEKRPVRLDLSELRFMDCSGVHLLINTLSQAREEGWDLEADPGVSAQVSRLFKLTNLEPFIGAKARMHR